MKKIALTASGLLVLVAAACSSGAAASPPTPPKATLGRHIAVSEGDMYLRGSVSQVVSGTVTFAVTNQGHMNHEFVIVAGNPAGTTGDEPGRVSEANHIGGENGPEIGNIRPDPTKTLSATLSPGTYTAMCNLPGHFQAGMHFTFVVA
jgi:uncharacterized cupredoxin-like copper-binding protein